MTSKNKLKEHFQKLYLLEKNQENSVENDLTTTFYESMIDFVIDSLTPLSLLQSSSSEISPTVKSKQSEIINEQNKVRVIYKSNNVFEGYMSKWIPHGIGRLFFRNNGTTYEGQFNDGLPEGNGVVKWPDGSWYKGEFENGLRHGRGLHVSAEDGRRWYSGQWVDGKRNGFGQTACCAGTDGAMNYIGDWLDNRPQGRGTGSWTDGTQYTGYWENGRPHGHGKAVWPNDDVYEGDWVNGNIDGTGTYQWNSNPRDFDQLILCLCDKYTGQWSKSKKHGTGEFYSAETGSIVRGIWTNDILDGPCEIILSTGQRLCSPGLVFQQNVLYETQLPSTPSLFSYQTKTKRSSRVPVPTTSNHQRCPISTVNRNRKLPATIEIPNSQWQWPCKPRLSMTVENGVRKPKKSPLLVRANVNLTAINQDTIFDLTSHVQKITSKDTEFGIKTITTCTDFQSELRSAECALKTYMNRLDDLYRTYGSFLTDSPIAYQPLMIRLGFWQMLIDSGVYAKVSLANFDDLLYENKSYSFKSAHNPFEVFYFWQFINAICVLATVIYNKREIQLENIHSANDKGLLATALHKLFAEYLNTNVVSVSYAKTGGNGSWMNSRKTITKMYDVYRIMMATTNESLPTARRLIQLYGPKSGPGDESSLLIESVLSNVIEIMLSLWDEQTDPMTSTPKLMTLFEYSVESIVTLLSKACPKIVDYHGILVDMETRLTFAEWYRFVLLCVHDCRQVPKFESENDSQNNL